MKIEYVRHKDIDFTRWDECILCSLNGIVYAYSWYLDIVAGEWDALVGDDYNYLFPLVKGKKYGVSYLYQPLFTQQLGLFSPHEVDAEIVQSFINSIPKGYWYWEINFNTSNTLQNIQKGVVERYTYRLDLLQPYCNLSSKYNENTRRNISKSIAMGVTVNKLLSVDEYVRFKKANAVVNLREDQLNTLCRLINQAIERGVGEIYAAYSARRELCAAAFFVRSNDKVIYLSAASNEIGKSSRAMFALVDRFVNDRAGASLILDFEGSSIESIARFYAGFGAKQCAYQQLIVNRLPWYLKLFKR